MEIQVFFYVRKFVTVSIIFFYIISIGFGSKLYRQVVSIQMGTNCTPLVADSFFIFVLRGTSCCLFLTGIKLMLLKCSKISEYDQEIP